MTTNLDNTNSLPSEFTRPIPRFSLLRVGIMTGVMAVAILLVLPEIEDRDPDVVAIESPELKSTNEQMGADEKSKDVGQLPPNRYQSVRALTVNTNQLLLSQSSGATPPKIIKHDKLQRAFVGRDIVNMRRDPKGKVIGQLTLGEPLEILNWDSSNEFVKVRSQFDQTGYVSSLLLTSEKHFWDFDLSARPSPDFDAVTLDIVRAEKSQDFDQQLSNFLGLLDTVKIKPSVDFAKTSLKYLIAADSRVIFPSKPGDVVSGIRRTTGKPGIYVEREKTEDPKERRVLISFNTRVPVRRVPADQPSRSTLFDHLQLSSLCGIERLSLKTVDKFSSKLELILLDIKKNQPATLTTRPHNGNPAYTWAFADLNGDSWQDVAIYLGGDSPGWIYKYLFVAQNINGRWELHRIDDYSGAKSSC